MKPDSTTLDRQAVAGMSFGVRDDSLADAWDLHDARAVAVLSLPPCSTVVATGLGDGRMARALGARMCRVWGVENDPEAVRTATPWCERILDGDIETLDLHSALAGERIDAILLLDGLKRSSDPATALRRVASLLAPGGRVVLVMPAALPGFAAGALGRTSLYELLPQAGLRALDEIRLAGSADGFGTAAGAVGHAGESNPDSCPYVLIAAPAVDPPVEVMPALAGAAMERLQGLERRYRRLEAHAQDLEKELARHHAARRALTDALEEAREWHRRSAAAVAAGADALRHEVRERERLGQRLAATAQELAQCQDERRFLRDDLVVKDAYLATLREENARHQEGARQFDLAHREHQRQRQHLEHEHQAQRGRWEHEQEARRLEWEERVQRVASGLDAAASERDAEAQRAGELEAANGALRRQLASLHEELHRVHTAVAETLAQPRYALADRINSWARRFRMVHVPLKRAWLARRRT